MPESNDQKEKAYKEYCAKLIVLVEKIRRSRKKENVDMAFSEIVILLNPKIKQIVYRFNIAGYSHDDIYQESLVALRFKAIKDYDSTRGSGEGPYPFDRFAVLCIRRHLATLLKASYQQKRRVLNFSISLDQDRNVNSSSFDDFLSLIDVFPQTDECVSSQVEGKEHYKEIFNNIYEKLSQFEREVFLLYMQRYSYDQITSIINKNKRGKDRVNIKSVDNALMRIKTKSYKILEKWDDPYIQHLIKKKKLTSD